MRELKVSFRPGTYPKVVDIDTNEDLTDRTATITIKPGPGPDGFRMEAVVYKVNLNGDKYIDDSGTAALEILGVAAVDGSWKENPLRP